MIADNAPGPLGSIDVRVSNRTYDSRYSPPLIREETRNPASLPPWLVVEQVR